MRIIDWAGNGRCGDDSLATAFATSACMAERIVPNSSVVLPDGAEGGSSAVEGLGVSMSGCVVDIEQLADRGPLDAE